MTDFSKLGPAMSCNKVLVSPCLSLLRSLIQQIVKHLTSSSSHGSQPSLVLTPPGKEKGLKAKLDRAAAVRISDFFQKSFYEVEIAKIK